jgi:hypothetical protein
MKPRTERARYVDDADLREHLHVRLPRKLILELDHLPGRRSAKVELAVREYIWQASLRRQAPDDQFEAEYSFADEGDK